MFQLQTDREYRIMMGTDIRIRRDPLAMRMREDQIKEIWGGDPVYPTINYIQDPDEIIDYREPEFHEPTPNMLSYLMEVGTMNYYTYKSYSYLEIHLLFGAIYFYDQLKRCFYCIVS